MNRNQFINLVKSPELLDNKSVSPIKDLLKDFPYCQTLHFLYIKNLQKENSIHYNNYIKIASTYASDRKKLGQFVDVQEEKLEVGSQKPEERSR